MRKTLSQWPRSACDSQQLVNFFCLHHTARCFSRINKFMNNIFHVHQPLDTSSACIGRNKSSFSFSVSYDCTGSCNFPWFLPEIHDETWWCKFRGIFVAKKWRNYILVVRTNKRNIRSIRFMTNSIYKREKHVFLVHPFVILIKVSLAMYSIPLFSFLPHFAPIWRGCRKSPPPLARPLQWDLARDSSVPQFRIFRTYGYIYDYFFFLFLEKSVKRHIFTVYTAGCKEGGIVVTTPLLHPPWIVGPAPSLLADPILGSNYIVAWQKYRRMQKKKKYFVGKMVFKPLSFNCYTRNCHSNPRTLF